MSSSQHLRKCGGGVAGLSSRASCYARSPLSPEPPTADICALCVESPEEKSAKAVVVTAWGWGQWGSLLKTQTGNEVELDNAFSGLAGLQ